MIKHAADGIFWNLEQHINENQVVPGAVYVIGREQFRLNVDSIRQLIDTTDLKIIFSNPTEGSDTIRGQIFMYGVKDLCLSRKMIIIGGGDMDDSYPCLQYDSFLPKILDYDENLKAAEEYKELYSINRPYKFLFLNGRARPHRTELILKLNDILDQSIWTNLDNSNGFPIRLLDKKYEYDHVVKNISLDSGFVKHELFDNKWGDVYVKANLYLDTYFSVVTETVFEYPYSFRTEKIWKPIAIGHPWVAVANCGYYRDLHNLGFKTFGNLIDESFDLIDNNVDRLTRISQVIRDLCQQDLASFLNECYNVCKYNQQHLAELQPRVQKEFPDRFYQFINERFRF